MNWFPAITIGLLVLGVVAGYLTAFKGTSDVEVVTVPVRSGRGG